MDYVPENVCTFSSIPHVAQSEYKYVIDYKSLCDKEMHDNFTQLR